MKTKLICGLLLLGSSMAFCQCGKDCAAKPETIRALNAAAKVRHLRWTVDCTTVDTWKFFGIARQTSDHSGAIYVEDGAKPFYADFGMTQEDAAQALLKKILRGALTEPSHSPTRMYEKCTLPPIHGGGQ